MRRWRTCSPSNPSPDFFARVRGRLADEEIAVTRPFPFLAAAAVLAAAAIVFVVVMLERRPEIEQPRVRVAAPGRSSAPLGWRPRSHRAVPVARSALCATGPQTGRMQGRRSRASDDVLIPAAEQQALRRLLERPPDCGAAFCAIGPVTSPLRWPRSPSRLSLSIPCRRRWKKEDISDTKNVRRSRCSPQWS